MDVGLAGELGVLPTHEMRWSRDDENGEFAHKFAAWTCGDGQQVPGRIERRTVGRTARGRVVACAGAGNCEGAE